MNAAKTTPNASWDQPVEIELAGLPATTGLAGRLAALARPGDVIALSGDLGAGKTEFARAFIRELGDPHEDVPSPTFTLVQMYGADTFEIYHFDLYRLENPLDAFELGIEDAFYDGVSLIEWPERLGSYLPEKRLDVELRITKGKNHRAVALKSRGGAWSERLRSIGHG